VPELSRFFGIIIRMFVEAGEPHHRPHFHATIRIRPPSLRSTRSTAWAEIHRAELQQDWELLQSGQPPVKIEPLR
jgi:hypothetical protein